MEVATDVTTFPCPKCGNPGQISGEGEGRCVSCGWSGSAMLFRPLSLQVVQAAAALPQDAVCVHHPDKRAVAVCTGTGNYICDLCRIDVDGQPYSAQYLDSGGKQVADKAFERFLPRPDKVAGLYLLLNLPPFCYCGWFLSPFWLVHGFFKLAEASRLRKSDPLYADVVSGTNIWLLRAVYILLCVVVAAGLVGLGVYFLLERAHAR